MTASADRSAGSSAYELLLRFYPASFRNEYATEMRALFMRRRRDAHGARVVALWMTTIVEVIGNAALVHWDILRGDANYTRRSLARTPGFTVTAIAIIAIGVGATTAAFSVTDFVLLRPLPFPKPEQLVRVLEKVPGYGRMELSPANYRDWKRGATVFSSLGMYNQTDGNLQGAGEPIYVNGAAVSFDLLPTLGVQPAMGRLFAEADDREGAAGTMILSYRFWQTRFGGEADIVGRTVLFDNERMTVIGVMPRAFRFPTPDIMFWTPQRFAEARYVDRTDNWVYGVGCLRSGVTFEQARAELDVLAAQSRRQYPKENANVGAAVFQLGDQVPAQSALMLWVLCGASACVLLIACANLANLLLARALGRRRELAVRAAIGAGRERMIRQLLTEALLLSTVGGVFGVLLAVAAVPLLNRLVPASLPISDVPGVDVRVLVFALVTTVITGVVFGMAPVARLASNADLGGLRDGQRSGGGQKEHLRSILVVSEVVVSVVLLVSAGLLMRALWTIQSKNPGFRSDGVLTLQTPLPIPQYGKLATRDDFYRRVTTDVRALPGVTNAAFISYLPLGKMRGGIWPVALDGRPVNRSDNQNAYLRYVTPGYFTTLGIPVVSGRDVDDSDTRDRQFVAVVSTSFIRRYWPGETPASVLGRHFTFAEDERVVAGVVGNVLMRGLERENDAEPQVYLPYQQVADGDLIGYVPRGFVVRSTIPPETLTASVRSIVGHIDPALPVSEVVTLSDLVERDTASRASQLRVIGAFAVIAFLLAGIGIHGLLSFAVSQRTQEIGVRVALGAQGSDILRMIVQRGLLLAIAGVIPGVALAYLAGRTMQALLAGVAPADVQTYASVVALAIVMTIAGTLVPAIRALRVDPITALRAE